MAWQNNKKIIGLWVYGPQNRNSWVNIQNLGWRVLWKSHDSQHEIMKIMAAAAKEKGFYVNFEEDGVRIKQMYVL